MLPPIKEEKLIEARRFLSAKIRNKYHLIEKEFAEFRRISEDPKKEVIDYIGFIGEDKPDRWRPDFSKLPERIIIELEKLYLEIYPDVA